MIFNREIPPIFRSLVRSAASTFAILLSASAWTQQTPDLKAKLDQLEKAIETRRTDLHVPGCAVAVVKDGKVIFAKGFGLRDREKALPVTADTQFGIGSSTKAFTVATIMMAKENGLLSLQDSPHRWIPYFKLYDPYANGKLDLIDMMSHRSGLERTDLIWAVGVRSFDELVRALAYAQPAGEYGKKFGYQNLMFMMVGKIAGDVFHEDWHELVTDKLLKPLGMNNSTVTIADMEKAKDYATGYGWNPETKVVEKVPYREIGVVAPAGAINSSVNDMTHWLTMLLAKGTYQGKQFLKPEDVEDMFAKRIDITPSLGYGLGWMLRDWKGHRGVDHGGNIDGFNAMVGMFPDDNLGYVMLTNVSNSPLTAEIRDMVATNLLVPKEPTAGAKAPVAEVDPAKEVGSYEPKEIPIKFVITFEQGKLYVFVPGQIKVEMKKVSGRTYKPLPPAPDNVSLEFRPVKDKPTETELVFTQGDAILICSKVEEQPKVDITADQLMAKVIEAMGGEAAWKKLTSIYTETDVYFVNQGVKAISRGYKLAPNKGSEIVRFSVLGKERAWQRSVFDGKRAWSESSFGPRSDAQAGDLDDAVAQSDIHDLLDWKTLYKTFKVTGSKEIDGQDCYVIEKKTERGKPVTEYVSKKSFLVIQSDAASGSSKFSDYRKVDGIMIPFTTETTTPGMGKVVSTVKVVKINGPIDPAIFDRELPFKGG